MKTAVLFIALLLARIASAEYYELRIYTVTSNKMDAVLERFRDTVEPVRKKHELKTLGYWYSTGTTNGEKFIYLMRAQSKAELVAKEKEFSADQQFKDGFAASQQKHGQTVAKMETRPLAAPEGMQLDVASSSSPRTFDLRIYSVPPEKLEAFQKRWVNSAVPIYERHGLHSIGWWIGEQKDSKRNEQFVCLLSAKSAEDLEKGITAFHGDPEWKRAEEETERDGKLRSGVTAYRLKPADFSPLK